MPVLKLCSKHRTLNPGRCPICANDRRDYTRAHVNQVGKTFRIAILQRDGYTCRWCGGFGDTLDYLSPLSQGGTPHDPENAVCACRSCNSRRATR